MSLDRIIEKTFTVFVIVLWLIVGSALLVGAGWVWWRMMLAVFG